MRGQAATDLEQDPHHGLVVEDLVPPALEGPGLPGIGFLPFVEEDNIKQDLMVLGKEGQLVEPEIIQVVL